ncbi:MAG: T9SS type A sorting domain-containing protein [Crocinitomicaceae bacterium]|nr:T9SS type A sorting domain-containing protein [Crocinitomicaceae bacterium]MCF8410498.1 T9SS type A sorting domain-containing protein [Crocinitomicaceae bacterium]
MKKFLVAFSFFLSLAALAQDGIVITLDGQTVDISGGTHQMIAPSNAVFDVPFEVVNNTGQTHQWVVTRLKVNVPTGWADGLCWGHGTDPFGGTCFSSTQMVGSPWSTPGSQSVLFNIADGEYGKMKPQINPDDFTSGQAHYRYYLSDLGSGYSDSVDLIIDFVATVKPIKEDVTVSIVPNPASDYINITVNGMENGTLKMVDILGNVVYKDAIVNSKSIATSNFKTGVYFVTIDAPGSKSISRKVIIRH